MANSCDTVTTGAHFGTCIPQRIFVGGIPRDTTEIELKSFFTVYGVVKDSKIITDKGGASRGYAFITFEKQEDAERLLSKDSEPIFFRNRRLNIGPAVKRHLTPQTSLQADSRDPTPMYFGNSLSYAYQNGIALIHPSSEENYGLTAQNQNTNYSPGAMVLPQHQAAYVSQLSHPGYSSYPIGATTQWLPASHWGLSSSASTQYVSANPAYYYAGFPSVQYAAPEVLYAPSTAHPYSLESSSYVENFQVETSSENMNTSADMNTDYLQPQNPAIQGKPTLIAYPRYPPTMALNTHYQNMFMKQPKKSLTVVPSVSQTILQKSFSDSIDGGIGNMLLTPPPTPNTK